MLITHAVLLSYYHNYPFDLTVLINVEGTGCCGGKNIESRHVGEMLNIKSLISHF